MIVAMSFTVPRYDATIMEIPMFTDESLIHPVPDSCSHEWVSVCVEGARSEDSPTVLVHQLCGDCQTYRIDESKIF